MRSTVTESRCGVGDYRAPSGRISGDGAGTQAAGLGSGISDLWPEGDLLAVGPGHVLGELTTVGKDQKASVPSKRVAGALEMGDPSGSAWGREAAVLVKNRQWTHTFSR